MRGPRIEWLEPGQDPTTAPYEPPRRHLRSCLTPIVLAIAFFGIIGVTLMRNKSSAHPLATVTATPTVTLAVKFVEITPTPSLPALRPSPTDTLEPSPTMILPTMTLAPTIEGLNIVAMPVGDSHVPTVSCTKPVTRECSALVATHAAIVARNKGESTRVQEVPEISIPTDIPEATVTPIAADLEQPIQPTADQR